MADILLGVDIGTTAVKAAALDAAGRPLAEASREIPLRTPGPLAAEQDPEDWYSATSATIREILRSVDARRVAGLGIGGQMHSLVLADAGGRVLRPALLWCDGRGGPEGLALEEAVGRDRWLGATGNAALAGFTASKVAWVRRHEPEIFRAATRICLPVSWLRLRLTGAYAMDVSEAAGTCLLDIASGCWHREILAGIGLSPDLLPPLVASGAVAGRLHAQGARDTGLPEGLPVAGGGADNPVGALATAIVAPGDASVSVGTSGVVFAFAPRPVVDGGRRLHTFHHVIPGAWYVMSVTLSAGFALRWFRDHVAGGTGAAPDYDWILARAAEAPPGSDGVLFLPYLNGERTPHNDPGATAAFAGLSARHGFPHLARAVLEGVAFSLRDGLDLMRSLGVAPERAVLTGGGSRGDLWCRILADVLGIPCSTLAGAGGVAHGAALLAGAAAGVVPDLPALAQSRVRTERTFEPDPAARSACEDGLGRYRALYPAIRSALRGDGA